MSVNNFICTFLQVSFFLSPFLLNGQDVLIVVHGTWAQTESWAQPGGNFFTTLQKNAGNTNTVLAFSWSGANTHQARITEAKRLVKTIEKLPQQTTITLVAHSHGGNVCFLASQQLAATNRTITTVYTLGTPISNLYQPNMTVIKKLYTLFSFGDPIQTVSGIFERVLPPHKHIHTLALEVNGTRPNHSQLHCPLVAQWLFAIPKMNPSVYGTLSLADNKNPHYTATPDLPCIIENEKKLYATLNFYLMPKNKKRFYQDLLFKKNYSPIILPTRHSLGNN